jgi:hypothetical protein
MKRTTFVVCSLALVFCSWVSSAHANTIPTAQALCYLWADQPTTASYQPSAPYSYNKAGGASANLVTRKAPGFYVVTCKKIGAFAGKRSGHVQVTASGIDATWCKVVTWGGGSGADLNAQVECRNPAGALADSYFDFLYVR